MTNSKKDTLRHKSDCTPHPPSPNNQKIFGYLLLVFLREGHVKTCSDYLSVIGGGMLQIILFPPLFGGCFKNRMPTLAHVQFFKSPPIFCFSHNTCRVSRETKKKKSEQVLMLSKAVSLTLYPTPNI
jgi:hypothetical protein